MNATEDGQPVGESPYLGGGTFGSPIQDRRNAAISEVRALHILDKGINSKVCIACFQIHPCPTIQAFDKWGV